MATKKLARTVIEGGRAYFNKAQRRNSIRSERRGVRQYSWRLRCDPSLAEASAAPRRKKVWRAHSDKLSAAERWMEHKVGKKWDEIRAEIARKFDTRTLAGQHIVFDHLLPNILGSGSADVYRPDFAIDEEGRLVRLTAKKRRASLVPPGKVARSWAEVLIWTQERRVVGRQGDVWYWFEATGYVNRKCRAWDCERTHFAGKNGVNVHCETRRSESRLRGESVA